MDQVSLTNENAAAFTKREREVIALLLEEKRPAEIAATLIIGRQTVYWHMKQIAAKMKLPNRRRKTLAKTLKTPNLKK